MVRVELELVALPLAFAVVQAIGRRTEGLVRNLRTGFERLAAARAVSGLHRGLHAKSAWRPLLTVAMDAKLPLYKAAAKEQLGSNSTVEV